MEFSIHARPEEEEKAVYNPTPLQQSASALTMPLPSLPLPHAAPEPRAAALCGSGGGGIRPHFNSTAVSASANNEGDTAAASLRYGECLRNHAASHGGHVLDGCGEFMPCGDDGLKCAACGCHRSFHRKDADGELNSEICDHLRGSSPYLLPLPNCLLPPPPPPPHPLGLQAYGSRGLLLRTGSSNGASAGEVTTELSCGPPLPQQFLGGSKKRFRSKFTAEQKEKMMRFAEKAGWRMQKLDEAEVEQFCGDVGVTRQVFKVWMHNNKNSMMRKQHQEKGDGQEGEEEEEEGQEEEEEGQQRPQEHHKMSED